MAAVERPEEEIQRTLAAITEWSNKAEAAHKAMDRYASEWATYLGNLRSTVAALERLLAK